MNTSKIIIGKVSVLGKYSITNPIFKEDYGLYLQIEGIELPPTYQVDFSNSENSGTSVTMIGNSDGVLIPHQFISTGKDVFAFLYHVGEDFGRTVYKFRIPNKVRPDRTNEEPTPEQQSTIDQAIAALNDAVEQTAQDVIDAGASAQSASRSAENAHDSAVDAQNYAESAQTSATQASASAESASASASASANSASQSAQIKADVEDLAEDAQASANASAQSATASANSASQAQGFANSASASAQSASGYASSAQTSANTASSKAEEASGYAQTATQKATESAQSASQALTYKTDAESAKTASQTAQGLAEGARDSAISAKNDAVAAKTAAETARGKAEDAQAAAESVAESIPSDYSQLSEDVSDLKEDLNAETDYLKSKNYDTRLATLNTMGVGHFVSGSTPSTNGNYTYYRHTPLISLRDLTITIDTPIDSGLYMVVSLFDENGEFVRVTRNGVSMTSATYSATKNWMTLYGQYESPYARLEFYRYPYVDITSDITVIFADDSENVSVKLNNLVNATTDSMHISFDTADFVSGYLNTAGALVESNEYKTSPFIAVNDQMVVTIGELMTTVWRTVFCYDSEQTLIETIEYNGKTTTTLTNYDVFLPHGTSYIRFVIGANRLSVASVTYKMVNIPYHHLAPSLLEHWNDQTFGKMNGLFKQATGRALITIIDDDTSSSAYVTMFHDACEAQGIKGSYAVITSRWDLDNTLKDTLLEFESEGYGMCAHCYVQDSKWNSPLNNMSLCESDMIHCIRDMQSAGFVNFRHWLTPAGHVETEMQSLAKRLGMVCAVSSGWNSIETTEAKYGRYAIRRCSLEASDRTGALTINDFKALIDEAVACNGWLLITTHMGNGEWDATAISERFDAIVDYAQSKYMKFTTLQEAWTIRRPIYEFYEQF